jgi:hypothetical protein
MELMLTSSFIFEEPPISVLSFQFLIPPRFFKCKFKLGLFHISKT